MASRKRSCSRTILKALKKDEPQNARRVPEYEVLTTPLPKIDISDEYDTKAVAFEMIGKNVLLTGRAGPGKASFNVN